VTRAPQPTLKAHARRHLYSLLLLTRPSRPSAGPTS
jgi:hypothetical protein